MVSRSQRTTVVQTSTPMAPTIPAPRARMAAWDQVSSGELAFDFTTPGTEPKSAPLDWGNRDRTSVKEAIIRWLEEQM